MRGGGEKKIASVVPIGGENLGGNFALLAVRKKEQQDL